MLYYYSLYTTVMWDICNMFSRGIYKGQNVPEIACLGFETVTEAHSILPKYLSYYSMLL